jgi:SAM-dependent methyltransferase
MRPGGLSQRLLLNSSRVHLERWNAKFAAAIPADSLVLDAGAGPQPYRHLLGHTRYEAADFEQVDKKYAKSTYVCDLLDIPVEDERFDYVICNQVLEHLPEPLAALKELNRVLKRGGKAIFTMPLFYEEHEQPYDFYRYTQFAHRFLFERAGFQIVSLEWMEGYLGTVAYQMDTASHYLPIAPRHVGGGLIGLIAAPFLAMLKGTCRVAAAVLYRLDIRHRYTGTGFPKNYVVIAAKPWAR